MQTPITNLAAIWALVSPGKSGSPRSEINLSPLPIGGSANRTFISRAIKALITVIR